MQIKAMRVVEEWTTEAAATRTRCKGNVKDTFEANERSKNKSRGKGWAAALSSKISKPISRNKSWKKIKNNNKIQRQPEEETEANE